jgi:hypothetical protein
MNDEQRRSMLRSLTDEQYHDIMNVLAIYPHIKMNVSYKGIQLSFTKKNIYFSIL